jgi:hypothetical protein
VTDKNSSDPAATSRAQFELGSLLLETASIEAYLEDFAARAADHIGAETECGITLRHRGHDRRAASSDQRAARCDDVEVATGAGPCITALDDQRTVTASETWRDTRWTQWRAAAEREGFRSAAALPANAGPGASIALNLYSERTDPFDTERLLRAAMFAEQVARVMALCIRISEQTVINEDLTAAMASRSTIDQAIGVMMAQNRCSAEEAFGILRRASSHRNVKLREVAAAVVEGITGSTPSAGPFQPRAEN